MKDFTDRVERHIIHVNSTGIHCNTEETTKQALILPLLDILGFSPFDPTKVKAEYAADFIGVKSGERVDYALFCENVPVMFVEAKGFSEKLTNHCPQLSRYFNAIPEITVAAITNGREWRFFTDLVNKNVMDVEPFLIVKLDGSDQDVSERLRRFHHDSFKPDAIRALAEESVYLSAFKSGMIETFRECDVDFIKLVASRANIRRNFTAKFVEAVQPIMKQALASAMSEMLVTSLNAPKIAEPTEGSVSDNALSEVDPSNPKIVTTEQERQILNICRDLLRSDELHGKDTETYFSVLYQGKTNRWLLRYRSDRKKSSVTFCLPLSTLHKAEIKRSMLTEGPSDSVILERPEDLLRLTGIVVDALAFCKDDANFRRQHASEGA